LNKWISTLLLSLAIALFDVVVFISLLPTLNLDFWLTALIALIAGLAAIIVFKKLFDSLLGWNFETFCFAFGIGVIARLFDVLLTDFIRPISPSSLYWALSGVDGFWNVILIQALSIGLVLFVGTLVLGQFKPNAMRKSSAVLKKRKRRK